jgi:predicted MPP superfamily phosphohydrolase
MEKILLVQLSDIHFKGWSGTSVHDLDADVRNELLRDAKKLTKGLGSVTGILVTGDIAFSGQEEEYKRAASWLKDLCGELECADESVSVVPGNHDVDRKRANSKITKTLHDTIRTKDEAWIDSELREMLSDPQSASALLEPLAEYNRFAARFQCSVSAEKPFWERDLVLACGTTIRLRGLCSALVSNAHDAKGNIVLGAAQASVQRKAGIEYMTLCHHPPDWLRDQDAVATQLESKVRIQLFGHKHAQRVQVLNNTLRLTAGAMHPERNGRDWEPVYNIIEISRLDEERIGVRLFQRRWHKTDLCFVADGDSSTGRPYRDYVWDGCPRPMPRQQVPGTEELTSAELTVSDTVALGTTAKDTNAMAPPNRERRLTYRFLTLPFRNQIAVAQSLNVLTDEDRALSDEPLFRQVFKRAAANGLLERLWEETEKFHTDPAPFNPFENPK